MAGRTTALALLMTLEGKGFEGEVIDFEKVERHRNRQADLPEVQELSAHPYGKRKKVKKRRLKRKGGSKL